MTEQNIRSLVIKALDKTAGILSEPAIARQVLTGGDIDLAELDVDSLTNLEIIMQIEDELGIELDADAVAAQTTLNALIDHIKAQPGLDVL